MHLLVTFASAMVIGILKQNFRTTPENLTVRWVYMELE